MSVVHIPVVSAALPPGHEDELFCPASYCRRPKEMPPGFSGPASVFWECIRKSSSLKEASLAAEAEHESGTASGEVAGDDVSAVLKVTPWGANHGEDRRTELLQQGYHTQTCASELEAEDSSDAEHSRDDTIESRRGQQPAQEFNAGIKVWSIFIGGSIAAWWFLSKGSTTSGTTTGVTRNTGSARGSSLGADEMRKKRLEALERTTSAVSTTLPDPVQAPTLTQSATPSPAPGVDKPPTAQMAENPIQKPIEAADSSRSKAPEATPNADSKVESKAVASAALAPSTVPSASTVFAVMVRGTLGGVQTAKSIEGLQASSTVEHMGDLVRKAFDSKDAKLRLFFVGKELKNTATVGGLGITAGSTVQAMFITKTSAVSNALASTTVTAPVASASTPVTESAVSARSDINAVPETAPAPPEALDGTPPSAMRAQGTLKGVVKAAEVDGLAGSLSVLSLERRIAEVFQSGDDQKLRLFYMGKELKDAAARLSALNIKTNSTIQVMFLSGRPRHLGGVANSEPQANLAPVTAAVAGADAATIDAVMAAAAAAGCNPAALNSTDAPSAVAPASKEEAWRALGELQAQLQRATDPNETPGARQASAILKQLLTTLTHDANPAVLQLAQVSVPDLSKIWGCEQTREWLVQMLNPEKVQASTSDACASATIPGSSA